MKRIPNMRKNEVMLGSLNLYDSIVSGQRCHIFSSESTKIFTGIDVLKYLKKIPETYFGLEQQ